MRATSSYMAVRNSPDFTKYNPHYFSAIFAAPTAAERNAEVNADQWEIPLIEFDTEDWTRRSMVLNAMRMSTEYFAHSSPRVLTLVEQRLQSSQSDVVHDLLVYLWERVLQVRLEMDEARALHAESLAAYLGVPAQSVSELLSAPVLSADKIQHDISADIAAVPRRTLDIGALVENTLARLQPEMEIFRTHENHILRLINDVVVRLYGDTV